MSGTTLACACRKSSCLVSGKPLCRNPPPAESCHSRVYNRECRCDGMADATEMFAMNGPQLDHHDQPFDTPRLALPTLSHKSRLRHQHQLSITLGTQPPAVPTTIVASLSGKSVARARRSDYYARVLRVPAWRNGRRGGLKIHFSQGSGGSSPSAGTIFSCI